MEKQPRQPGMVDPRVIRRRKGEQIDRKHTPRLKKAFAGPGLIKKIVHPQRASQEENRANKQRQPLDRQQPLAKAVTKMDV
ncbi:MAG: hypothetical protein NTY01_18965 [Verrucomicrobia bacterium]|nr:hypothetical protein [Verrucomicrobiota bacterium]